MSLRNKNAAIYLVLLCYLHFILFNIKSLKCETDLCDKFLFVFVASIEIIQNVWSTKKLSKWIENVFKLSRRHWRKQKKEHWLYSVHSNTVQQSSKEQQISILSDKTDFNINIYFNYSMHTYTDGKSFPIWFDLLCDGAEERKKNCEEII